MKFPVKNEGSVLLPTLIISGMLLALALALTKIVSNELQFSADLLLAERAYFAAESGVEQALFSLKTEPINWVDNEETKLPHNATTSVSVENSQSSFPFFIEPKESLRWQFGNDSDPSFETTLSLVQNFIIEEISSPKDLQWKFQCAQELSPRTEMLQARALSSKVTGETSGTWDNGIETGSRDIHSFLISLPEDARCFISLTNFSNNNAITGTFSTDKKMAPPQTIVRAKGSAGGREKIIEFEYRQKNLTPFFDFGLLQKTSL